MSNMVTTVTWLSLPPIPPLSNMRWLVLNNGVQWTINNWTAESHSSWLFAQVELGISPSHPLRSESIGFLHQCTWCAHLQRPLQWAHHRACSTQGIPVTYRPEGPEGVRIISRVAFASLCSYDGFASNVSSTLMAWVHYYCGSSKNASRPEQRVIAEGCLAPFLISLTY